MRKFAVLIVLLSLAVVSAGAFEYEGRTIKPFTADQYSVDKSGKEQMVGKIYIGDEGVRTETTMDPEQGHKMVTIFLVKDNIQYFINPQTKKYYETNIKPEDLEKWVGEDIQVEKKDVLGTEKIQGYKCDIRKVTTKVKVLGFSKTVKSTQYIAKKLNISIKTVNEDGSYIEYRNIDEGNPSSKLFKLPDGLTKTGTMMGIFMGGESGEGDTDSDGTGDGTADDESDHAAPKASDVLKGIFG